MRLSASDAAVRYEALLTFSLGILLQQAQGTLAVGAAVVRLRARVCWPSRARVDERGMPPERMRVPALQAAGHWLGAAERSGMTLRSVCQASVHLFLGLERDKP